MEPGMRMALLVLPLPRSQSGSSCRKGKSHEPLAEMDMALAERSSDVGELRRSSVGESHMDEGGISTARVIA